MLHRQDCIFHHRSPTQRPSKTIAGVIQSTHTSQKCCNKMTTPRQSSILCNCLNFFVWQLMLVSTVIASITKCAVNVVLDALMFTTHLLVFLQQQPADHCQRISSSSSASFPEPPPARIDDARSCIDAVRVRSFHADTTLVTFVSMILA